MNKFSKTKFTPAIANAKMNIKRTTALLSNINRKMLTVCLTVMLSLTATVSSVQAQTLDDIDTVWTATVPMRSAFVGIITLQNGNYLAYGRNSYAPSPITGAENHALADNNELYLVEFTETGNILRYKTIPFDMPTPDYSDLYSRRYISHSKVVERPDGGLLIISEFEHGASVVENNFNRIILDANWTVTSNGLYGVQVNSYTYNNETFTYIRPTRLLALVNIGDKILAGFSAVKKKADAGGPSRLQGIIFLDFNGNVYDMPEDQDALRVLDINGGSTITAITKAGNSYIFTEDGTDMWRSTDLECTEFTSLPSIPSCPPENGCISLGLSKNFIDLPNSGGFAAHGYTGNMVTYYHDNYQYALWRWDNQPAILSPAPYWFEEHKTLGGFILLNNASFDALNQDRYLVRSASYDPSNPAIATSVKIAEIVFSSNGMIFNEGPSLSAPSLGMSLPSLDNSGIICGGTTVVDGERRIIVGKMSMCKGFTLTPHENSSYVSGASIAPFTYTASGAYPAANVTYSWRIVLKSGVLSSHPAATVGTVLTSGTGNIIPSGAYYVDVNASEAATLLVEYAATQTWGTPEQVCNTASSYEIQLQHYPDNVVETDCAVPVTGMVWSINPTPTMLGNDSVSTYQTPCIGDLDGDGNVEIVVAKSWSLQGGSNHSDVNEYATDGFYVFDRGNNTSRLIITDHIFSTKGLGQIGIAKPNATSDGLIVVAAMDGYLYAYNKDGTRKWTSNNVYTTYNVQNDGSNGFKSASVMFSDFNGDGNVEIVTSDRIFDLETGVMLLDLGFKNTQNIQLPSVSVTDVNRDGQPELIWGCNIYSINITSRTGTSGNSYTVASPVTDPDISANLLNNSVRLTAPIDIDLDGNVDILVYAKSYFYIYNPSTGDIKVKQAIASEDQGNGTPFVGDIDGDGYPEIMYGETALINKFYNIIAWDIDAAGLASQSATVKWRKGTTDSSYGTGLTLFDFNQDGTFEILYRDESSMRIFNGFSQATMNTPLDSIKCVSGTLYEYPVTADVDNDGEAEIIVTGTTPTTNSARGYVYIFKAGTGTRWAPARKVWNQYAYNVVNINEDLTVPTKLFDVATIMAGADSIVGNADDVQPFNGFLKQATMIDRYGNMVMYAPDAFIYGNLSYDYDAAGDSLTVTVQVGSRGESAVQPPLYITAYRSDNTVITFDSVTVQILKDAVVPIQLVVHNYSAIQSNPFTIRLNSRDGVHDIQTECNYGNNIVTVNEASILRAQHDRVSTVSGTSITIDVMANDSIPNGCAPALSTPVAVHGSATAVNDSVLYTPATDFTGHDTVAYSISCNGNTSTAYIYIYVAEKPDNISDADCYVEPPATAWSIKVDWSSSDIVSTLNTPFVGDLDNDGVPEIVCFGDANRTGNDSPTGILLNTVLIYDGKTRDLRTTIPLKNESAVNVYVTGYDGSAYGLVKRPSDNKGLVVVACNDYYLRAYDVDGNKEWVSNATYGSETEYAVNIGFADFNNDGYPELYVRNKIFDASTGILLATAAGGTNVGEAWSHYSDRISHKLSSPIAADVWGDSQLELILGNEIYEVNITNTGGTENNSVTIIKTVTPPVDVPKDGYTQAADFNRDGHLDVFIVNRTEAGLYGTVYGYVWDVYNNTVSSPITIATNTSGISVPLIGDIDNDKQLEVLIQCGSTERRGYKCYKYNSTGSGSFSFLWDFVPDENTYSNSATMFDFNQDGMNEVLLIDQTKVRILNGSGKSHLTKGDTLAVYTMTEIPFGEVTIMQYPVIADVDADGQAEIVLVGDPNGVSNAYNGSLNILKSNGSQWAPARKVWNQYVYNAANINENLTVPRYPLNPATIFPGKDGILGTEDDVRPYNNVLQQQTALNVKGTPFWITPNALFAGTPVFSYHGDGDSLVISTEITNTGDAPMAAPFYISAYKDEVKAVNKMAIDSSMITLDIDATLPVTVTIRNLSSYLPLTNILVRINDRGEATYVQPECDTVTDNTLTVPFAGILMAQNDHVPTASGIPVKFDVMANDSIPDGCTPVLSLVTTATPRGSATLTSGNDSVIYTPTDPAFYGFDSIVYSISCNGNTSTAYIYIYVAEMPDNVSDEDCYVTPPPTTWGITNHWSSDASVCTYITPLVGDLDDDDIPEIVCIGSAGEYGGSPFYAVTVLVFDGKTHALKRTITLDHAISAYDCTGYGIVKIPEGRKGLIVVADESLYLRAFDITGAQVWVSDQPYGTVTNDFAVNVAFADFNNDGYPEVYVRDKIFDASTGKLLATATGGSNTGSAWAHQYSILGRKLSSPIAANVLLETNSLELILGNEIYTVNIISRENPLVNSVTLHQKLDLSGLGIAEDGHAQVADFNGDGVLDILITNRSADIQSGATVNAYVWDIVSNTIMGTPLSIATHFTGKSIPLIADVNNNGIPDMVIQCAASDDPSNLKIRAYECNAGVFTYLWGYAPYEDSYSNGATLFDFNLDGVNEVLISDQSKMHILQGTDGDVRASLDFSETTIMQYPIIADVDNDGSAEIVAVGNNRLNILKSSGTPWAPARKVWNQYMYNAVNVNEDLTVPRYQFNPATFFPGEDGVSGNGADIQPYNNFLQQQTALNTKGTPLWITPDALFTGTPVFSYHDNGDSLVIYTEITNTGDAPMAAPFYVSAYKNEVKAGNKMAIDSSMITLDISGTMTVTVTVRNLSSYFPLTNILVRINDRGEATYVQPECDTVTNNTLTVPFAGILMAQNDHVPTASGIPVKFDVMANDSIPDGCTPVLSLVTTATPRGSAELTSGNDSVIYTPTDPAFYGFDSLVYSISCNGNTSTAYIYIYVAEMPDNVSDEDCYIDPEAFEWSITSAFTSTETDLATYMTPVAGDLDGDGIPEIVAAKYLSDNNHSQRLYSGFYVYWGNDRSHPTTVNTVSGPFYSFGPSIARIDSAGIVNPLVVMVGHFDGILYAYNALTGALSWQSDVAVYDFNQYQSIGYSLQFVDFSSDGKVEILAGNHIYDAATGKLLLDLGDLENKGHSLHSAVDYHKYVPAAGDLDGDGKPEYAAGNKAYSINITNNGGETGNTFKLLAEIPAQTFDALSMSDGNTLLADINGDGRLDVLASKAMNPSTIGFFAWDVQTRSVISKGSTGSSNHYHGMPFVGNVDTIPGVEILFTTTNRIKGYRYSPTGNFVQVYEYAVSDPSGATGITLFDFNQDGKSELVYRDESNLRIMQALPAVANLLGTFKDLETIPGGSGTGYEYPIVLDVDNDGGAEIVTVAGASKSKEGTLRIYKSATRPWSPARKVWNQYSYNVVNINEDLTVPRWQLNPAIFFPGKDGVPGNDDDIQPYNNFLQQQTTLSLEGVPLWITPDVLFAETPSFHYYGYGDSLVVSIKLTNTGDAPLAAPFYVSAYDKATGTKMATDSSMTILDIAATQAFTLTVRNMSSHLPLTNILIRINDRGAATYDQPECDTVSNNMYEHPEGKLLMTLNDTIAMLYNTVSEINVKLGDLIPANCSTAVPKIEVDPVHGDAEIVGDMIRYSPETDFYGVDSLVYSVTCISNDTVCTAEAKVYVIVNKPEQDSYTGCYNKSTKAGFVMDAPNSDDIQYFWYTDETGGAPVATGYTNDCAAPCVMWAEVQYKGNAVQPRIKADIKAYDELTAGSIVTNQIICYDAAPNPLVSLTPADGGDYTPVYQWQDSADVSSWQDIDGATSEGYAPGALTVTTKYRRSATNGCGTVYTDPVTITALPKLLFNYPDIRIRICPDGGTVNLSKYLDTLALQSIKWESVSPHVPIIDVVAGTISTDMLKSSSVYTFNYTVTNYCTSDVKRRVYLEVLKPDRMRPLRETAVICYEYAEALQINQLFGIEAGGTWSYSDELKPYITESTSPTHIGAVVMNGKGIYENDLIPLDTYHGVAAKRVTITYTPAINSCLADKFFTVEIILTESIVQ